MVRAPRLNGWWLLALLACAAASALLRADTVSATIGRPRKAYWLPVWTEGFEYFPLAFVLLGLLAVMWCVGRRVPAAALVWIGLVIGVIATAANFVSDTGFYVLKGPASHSLLGLGRSSSGQQFAAVRDAIPARRDLAGKEILLIGDVEYDAFYAYAGVRTRTVAAMRCSTQKVNLTRKTGFNSPIYLAPSAMLASHEELAAIRVPNGIAVVPANFCVSVR